MGISLDMLVGPTPSTFLVLEGGTDDKLCPLILFRTFTYLSWSLALSSLHNAFRIPNLSPSRGSSFNSCPHIGMMMNLKWPSLHSYMTSFPCFTRIMYVLMNKRVCCLHTHFTNLHIGRCVAYQMTMCTHFITSFIPVKILSIILI